MSSHLNGKKALKLAFSTLLCSGVSMLALSSGAIAQDTAAPAAEPVEDQVVIVKGVRGSQLRAVDIKKRAIAQVDGISAEDIGKLPDTTIADSLQRVPGIQIIREAGEGASVQIRGLGQTYTLMNGEQYLSAGNIGQAQANFLDVPSQLMSGVVVYKSVDPRTPLAGISGTIDLQTRRPFQMPKGLSLTGAAEASRGDYTKENDYMVNGLASWRNDRIGILASVAIGDTTNGNNYSGSGGGVFSQNDWGAGQPQNFIAPHGFEVYNRSIQRKRTGANLSFQAKLDDGWTLTGDVFYAKLEEHNRAMGLNISNRWDGGAFATWLTPDEHTDTGLDDSNGTPWWNVSSYDINAQWLNSFTVNRTNNSESTNYNLELKYDNGGKFTAETRFISARASRLSMNGQVQGDLSNWQYDAAAPGEFTLFRNPDDRSRGTFYPADICSKFPASQRSNAITGSAGGCYLNPNPEGYNSNPLLHVDFAGGNAVFDGFGDVMARAGGLGAGKTTADYMANLNSYRVGAFSSEGNNDASSTLNVARADGHYRFDEKALGIFTKLDAGVRVSQRTTDIEQFHLFSNFYAGKGVQANGQPVPATGCLAQWKAIDVVMDQGQCSAGEMVPSATNPAVMVFQGYTVNKPTRIDEFNNVVFVEGLGGDTASGIPGFWAVDPKDFDDVRSFHEKVFGGAVPITVPGQTYEVNMYENNVYASGEFEVGIFSGNVGVRVIQTELNVKQNVTGDTLAYGDTNADTGDTVTNRKYTDVLPSLNINADVTDQFKVRFGYAKTMQPLDLGNYGGSIKINTNDDPGHVPPRRVVTSANSNGNPYLDPWRSTNTNLSAEYYLGRGSVLSAAIFDMQIKSFVVGGQILSAPGQFVNSDGSPAGAVPIFLPIQGDSGKVQGLELGAKIALADFVDGGFLSNLGVDTNYTYSPSESGDVGLDGEKLPFFNNSRDQFNLIGWYQDDKLQIRVAYNYRSERLQNIASLVDNSKIPIFAEATNFIDVNATYDVTDRVSLYFNGSNVTGETETYNYHFGDSKQYAFQNQFEPRYILGVRAKW